MPRPSNGEKAVFQPIVIAKLDIQIQKNEAGLTQYIKFILNHIAIRVET